METNNRAGAVNEHEEGITINNISKPSNTISISEALSELKKGQAKGSGDKKPLAPEPRMKRDDIAKFKELRRQLDEARRDLDSMEHAP